MTIDNEYYSIFEVWISNLTGSESTLLGF